MTAIAPVIVLSVGNRVQARRVELATQAARSYVDSLRGKTIEAPKHSLLLNEISTTIPNQFNPQRIAFASVAAPTAGSLNCTIAKHQLIHTAKMMPEPACTALTLMVMAVAVQV